MGDLGLSFKAHKSLSTWRMSRPRWPASSSGFPPPWINQPFKGSENDPAGFDAGDAARERINPDPRRRRSVTSPAPGRRQRCCRADFKPVRTHQPLAPGRHGRWATAEGNGRWPPIVH